MITAPPNPSTKKARTGTGNKAAAANTEQVLSESPDVYNQIGPLAARMLSIDHVGEGSVTNRLDLLEVPCRRHDA